MRKRFMQMDAGERREYLARFLVDWRAQEFIPLPSSKRFWREVRILARQIGSTSLKIYGELQADADLLAAE